MGNPGHDRPYRDQVRLRHPAVRCLHGTDRQAPVRSCGITVGEVLGKDITTIEGLSSDSSHPVQKAWIAEQVPQCGYCQSGQILAAVSLLQRKSNPTDKDIDRGMLNLCRCGTYTRVRKAIHRAADMLKEA